MTVRSLNYLNQREVLYFYVDITVLIWQNVRKLFPAKIYRLKVKLVALR